MTLQIFVLWYLHSLKNKYKILIRHMQNVSGIKPEYNISAGFLVHYCAIDGIRWIRRWLTTKQTSKQTTPFSYTNAPGDGTFSTVREISKQ
jgi:hypothetical protein